MSLYTCVCKRYDLILLLNAFSYTHCKTRNKKHTHSRKNYIQQENKNMKKIKRNLFYFFFLSVAL